MKINNNYSNYNKLNTHNAYTSRQNFTFKNTSDVISFSSKTYSPIELFAKVLVKPISKLSEKKWVQNFTKWAEKDDNYKTTTKNILLADGKTIKKIKVSKHVNNIDKLQTIGMVGLSVFLDNLYIARTLKSKKIEKDRKNTLAINQAITMVLSFVGALALDNALFGAVGKIKDKFGEVADKTFKLENEQLKINGKTILKKCTAGTKKNLINNIKTGIGIMNKTLVIAIVYRFLAPVVATPLADKVTKFAKKQGLMK